MHKFNEIINGNHPFTYETVLRSNVTGAVDAGNHPDIIFSKGDSCATIRYGGTTIGFYICNSAGNWSDTLFNTSQYGNQFTTVTGTYSPENGGTLAVYFNGEPICTLPNVGSVKPSDLDLWIGKDPENPGRTGSGDYTGGICCKSCHAVITQGQVIPKLTPTPTPVIPVTPSEPAQNPFNENAGKNSVKFGDVADNAWYASAVRYAVENGLMNGTGTGKFSPAASTTRGMVMTILARMAGADTSGTPWYAAGMNWAKANGVSDGTNTTASLTREQLVTMLFRYAAAHGMESVTLEENLSRFTDKASVSAWAVPAMNWAVGQGLIEGSNGLLRPQANASRAEVAAILMRFAQKIAK